MDIVFNTEQGVFNYRVAGVWIKDDHILLHRAADDHQWSLPGGRVAMAEESSISIKREFREELNVDVKIERLVWIVENFFTYEGKKFHEIGFYFKLTQNGQAYEIVKEPFYGVEGERLIYQWFPLNEIKDIELYPSFLKTALSNLPPYTEHITAKQ